MGRSLFFDIYQHKLHIFQRKAKRTTGAFYRAYHLDGTGLHWFEEFERVHKSVGSLFEDMPMAFMVYSYNNWGLNISLGLFSAREDARKRPLKR